MKHKHQCGRCTCVWSHDGFKYDDPLIAVGHTCPWCGHHSAWCYYPYTGERLPDYVNHHTEESKPPVVATSWQGPNREALYWHMVREHHFTSHQLKGKNHQELAHLHDGKHESQETVV